MRYEMLFMQQAGSMPIAAITPNPRMVVDEIMHPSTGARDRPSKGNGKNSESRGKCKSCVCARRRVSAPRTSGRAFRSDLVVFLNVGPLNAAMANVLPADLRTRGFAITTMTIHLFGDGASPWLIGLASDRIGLTGPILVAGFLLAVSGMVLLAGRGALERDWPQGLADRDER